MTDFPDDLPTKEDVKAAMQHHFRAARDQIDSDDPIAEIELAAKELVSLATDIQLVDIGAEAGEGFVRGFIANYRNNLALGRYPVDCANLPRSPYDRFTLGLPQRFIDALTNKAEIRSGKARAAITDRANPAPRSTAP